MKETEQNLSGLLAGKVALVTGGATGIGEAVAKLFAMQGASVVVNGLPGDPVDEVVKEIHEAGGRAIACPADVGVPGGANNCVRAAIETFESLDILVANAGLVSQQGELQDLPLESFDELMHSNMRGIYLSVRAALPALKQSKGVILTAGSEAGLKGVPEGSLYSATKGWIIAFSRSIAVEQAKYGIRCNVVAPGPIDTEMTRPPAGAMATLQSIESVPLGRRGTPEEVANVYLFLASNLASYVTGAVYSVDGGSTAAGGLPGLQAKRAAKTPPEGTLSLEHQYEGRGTLQPK
jgi:NAD(P)-dependent dehydrogenase (short-subunit alcohol dehydrogenase family)